jgi:tetratricopeptide (TPR) repeat protein
MEMAEKVGDLVTEFVASLEDHPNGAELITLVERVLAGESQKVDSAVIATLRQLSNNNGALLVDFWILRGHIMKEEGHDQAAFQTFMEAAQWEPRNLGTWMRLVEMFVKENELFKATFFLQQAKEYLGTDDHLLEGMEQIEARLRTQLSYSPGIGTGTGTEQASVTVSTQQGSQETMKSEEGPNTSNQRTSSAGGEIERRKNEEVDKVWELAVECYEGAKGDNLVYRHAFVHYAHATVRKLLGIEGKFKDGLERGVAQHGFFEHQSFFKWLNQLRNKVALEDYMPTQEEVKRVYAELSPLVG